MKKIPCVFQRRFEGNKVVEILPEATPGCEWVLAGEGEATVKFDGTACMVRGGVLHRRFDAKQGKAPPHGWEACQERDDVTGHHPGWVPVGDEPDSRWHREAWRALPRPLADGTYELVGPKISGNAEGMSTHRFLRHSLRIAAPRDFDGLRAMLGLLRQEGLVFHHPDGRMAKIRRVDFGLPWPLSRGGAGARDEATGG